MVKNLSSDTESLLNSIQKRDAYIETFGQKRRNCEILEFENIWNPNNKRWHLN